MDLELVKVVNKDKTYVDKEGKKHTSCNYYLVINNTYVAVRPCFAKGYSQLDLVSRLVINGKLSNESEN